MTRDPTRPSSYPRRILLCATGLSPQVVTETLYVLACKAEPKFIPTEVRLVTTAEGARRAELTLLDPKVGQFWALCADYGLPPIAFRIEHVHLLCDEAGTPLADIRSRGDNEAAADSIVRLVAELTRDPDSSVHVSIAGGRKTMGFYAGYALSLYGRAQDRLSHVLVSPDYEGLSDFYYPTVQRLVLRDRANNPLDASQARVELADIPFVRLREDLPVDLLEGRVHYSAVVSAAEAARGPLVVKLHCASRQVEVNGTAVQLSPQSFVVLAWLARRLESTSSVSRNDLMNPAARREIAELAESIYRDASVELQRFERCYRITKRALHEDVFDPEIRRRWFEDYDRTQLGRRACQWFSERILDIQNSLIKHLDAPLAARAKVQVERGIDRKSHYSLQYRPQWVEFP